MVLRTHHYACADTHTHTHTHQNSPPYKSNNPVFLSIRTRVFPKHEGMKFMVMSPHQKGKKKRERKGVKKELLQ